MKKSISELLEKRKAEVQFRTDRTWAAFGRPQLSASAVIYEVSEKTRAVVHGGVAVVYEVAEKTRAVAHGGVAMIHQIVVQSGLVDVINAVPVLKKNMPYHESDHVLNIAYNFLCGGTALDHMSIVGKTRRISTCSCFVRMKTEENPPVIGQCDPKLPPKKIAKALP